MDTAFLVIEAIFVISALAFLLDKKWSEGVLCIVVVLLAIETNHECKKAAIPGKVEEVRFERILYHMGNEYSILVDGQMNKENFGSVQFLYDAKEGEKSWVKIQRNVRGGAIHSEFHLHNPQELGTGSYKYLSGKQTKQGSTTVVE